MRYEPIKESLGRIFKKSPWARIIFYKLLDLLILRTWHVHRELRKWKKSAPNKAHILDAGCGFGQFAYHLSKMSSSFSILGIEEKKERVCECNAFFREIRKENALFKCTDLGSIEMRESFHLVLLIETLKYVENDIQLLKNLNSSMKTGGLMLVSAPSEYRGAASKDDLDDDNQFREFYKLSDLKDKLKQAGFSKVKSHYSYGIPGQISWKFSMKIPLQLLNKSKLFIAVLPFYYLVVFPMAVVLNFIDSHTAHSKGSGLLVLAWK